MSKHRAVTRDPVRERFKALVKRWTNTLRVKPRQIRIQHMTKKWGSCSAAGRVSFASLVLKEPRPFQEYVIVHELLHLRVRNHGQLHRAYVAAHLGAQPTRLAASETTQRATASGAALRTDSRKKNSRASRVLGGVRRPS